MRRFTQLHILTAYPPSNLNRDDLGRPKTAIMGGAERLRVSSQSLKRAWRTSDVFQDALAGHIGTRTKAMGVEIYQLLLDAGADEAKALEWARAIAGVFGKSKGVDKSEQKKLKAKDTPEDEKQAIRRKYLEIEQLAHFSPEERTAVGELTAKLVERGEGPQPEELELLRKRQRAADIALFGRMLASRPEYNIEAAAQVAHAISVHGVAVQDDFFTAVDDLNAGAEDMGAAHMGESEFGAAVFYQYVCLDKALLQDNLGDETLRDKTIAALVEAAATVAPIGKQNSYASRARASYILCETGNQQPRSLSVAFLEPIKGTNVMRDAIKCLEDTRDKMEHAYEACADKTTIMNAHKGEGSLRDVIAAALE